MVGMRNCGRKKEGVRGVLTYVWGVAHASNGQMLPFSIPIRHSARLLNFK